MPRKRVSDVEKSAGPSVLTQPGVGDSTSIFFYCPCCLEARESPYQGGLSASKITL